MYVEGPQIDRINRWKNSFQNMYGMLYVGINWPFGQKKSILGKKKRLIFGYFGGHESELPDFGRTWTPNGWHQVNFWGAPENFGV